MVLVVFLLPTHETWTVYTGPGFGNMVGVWKADGHSLIANHLLSAINCVRCRIKALCIELSKVCEE